MATRCGRGDANAVQLRAEAAVQILQEKCGAAEGAQLAVLARDGLVGPYHEVSNRLAAGRPLGLKELAADADGFGDNREGAPILRTVADFERCRCLSNSHGTL